MPSTAEPRTTERYFPVQGALLPTSHRLIRQSLARNHIQGLRSAWSAWDAFADYHHLDPEHPADHHLVAFVQARADAGIGWTALNATLTAVRLAVEHTARLHPGSVTIPAHRHLSDLYDAGTFDPALQAPLISVGQVRTLTAASQSRPRQPRDAQLLAARDQALVAVTYVAALRPNEWTWLDLEHVQVTDGRLTLLLPHTKTGDWQRVDVCGLARLEDLDPAAYTRDTEVLSDPGATVPAELPARTSGTGTERRCEQATGTSSSTRKTTGPSRCSTGSRGT